MGRLVDELGVVDVVDGGTVEERKEWLSLAERLAAAEVREARAKAEVRVLRDQLAAELEVVEVT